MGSSWFRSVIAALVGAGVVAVAAGAEAQTAPPTSIKIGFAISKTGPNAPGANTTVIPNYKLWVHDVNQSGGILLSSIGKRVPIEVVDYDDRSTSEEAVRAVDRLIAQDKVDLLLAPWGTAATLAVAPLFAKAGLPLLAGTAITDMAPQLAKRWPNSFWLLGTSAGYAQGLVDEMVKWRSEGKIGAEVAMVSVADGFGIELSKAARLLLKKAGFSIVYDKAYPIGTQDMQPVIAAAMGTKADSFLAFSYPPDTLAIVEQSRVVDYRPKLFYTGVGTSFTLLKDRFGGNTEDIMGVGGADTGSDAFKAYRQRHVDVTGQEPDRWASPVVYAGLQMLQQAIEHVGKIDRAAIVKDLQTDSFETVMGRVRMVDNIPQKLWSVGQWQNGAYVGIAPASMAGAVPAVVPKADWKAPAP